MSASGSDPPAARAHELARRACAIARTPVFRPSPLLRARLRRSVPLVALGFGVAFLSLAYDWFTVAVSFAGAPAPVLPGVLAAVHKLLILSSSGGALGVALVLFAALLGRERARAFLARTLRTSTLLLALPLAALARATSAAFREAEWSAWTGVFSIGAGLMAGWLVASFCAAAMGSPVATVRGATSEAGLAAQARSR